jgi:hypothetical protein
MGGFMKRAVPLLVLASMLLTSGFALAHEDQRSPINSENVEITRQRNICRLMKQWLDANDSDMPMWRKNANWYYDHCMR